MFISLFKKIFGSVALCVVGYSAIGHCESYRISSIACKSEKSSQVELMDYYVARQEAVQFTIDLGPANATVSEKVNYTLQRLKKYDLAASARYQQAADRFTSEAQFLNRDEFISYTRNLQMPKTLPGCNPEPFVIQVIDPNVMHARYLINDFLWNKSDANTQAGVVLNELVFTDFVRLQRDSDLEATQYYVAEISSNNLNDLPVTEYEKILEAAKFTFSYFCSNSRHYGVDVPWIKKLSLCAFDGYLGLGQLSAKGPKVDQGLNLDGVNVGVLQKIECFGVGRELQSGVSSTPNTHCVLTLDNTPLDLPAGGVKLLVSQVTVGREERIDEIKGVVETRRSIVTPYVSLRQFPSARSGLQVVVRGDKTFKEIDFWLGTMESPQGRLEVMTYMFFYPSGRVQATELAYRKFVIGGTTVEASGPAEFYENGTIKTMWIFGGVTVPFADGSKRTLRSGHFKECPNSGEKKDCIVRDYKYRVSLDENGRALAILAERIK